MARTHRRAALASGTLAGALLLAACSSSNGSPHAEAGSSGGQASGTVRMLVNISPNLTLTFWKNLVKPFEAANPGIKVKIEPPSAASVDATLTTELAAGTEPDVEEGGTVQPIHDRLLDLTDLSWAANAPLAKSEAIGGRIYAVPLGVQLQSLIFYNKDAFQKAGITAPPTTMDELTADLGKLKASGILPMQTAGDTWVTGAQVSMIAAPTLFANDPNWYKDVAARKLKLSSSLKPVLDLYNGWLHSGYLAKDALGVKYLDAQANFLAGKSAMYPMGSWFVGAATKPSFPIGVFRIPAITPSAQPTVMGGAPDAKYAIFKNTAHKAAALKLVQYLTYDKVAVETQLATDGTFRDGYSSTPGQLSADVNAILKTVSNNLVPIGNGYGENQLPTGYAAQLHKLVQGLYIGQSVSSVGSGLDSWLAAQPK